MTKKSYAVVFGLVAALAACDDNPTAPTGNAVVIYQDKDFKGDDQPLAGNQPDLDNLPGCGGAGNDWSGCISSIRVPSGWEITVFERDAYAGASMTFTADVADLKQQPGPCGNDWDNCVASLQVRQR